MKKVRNMRLTFCWMGLAGFLALAASGCGKSVAQKASESDANGYVCENGHKFYTERKVFADQCPVCATVKLTEVYGFVCEVTPAVKPEDWTPGCGQVILAPRTSAVSCDKCKRRLSSVLLPSSKTLAAWGATPATQKQVALH
jgi:hypothetical protein